MLLGIAGFLTLQVAAFSVGSALPQTPPVIPPTENRVQEPKREEVRASLDHAEGLLRRGGVTAAVQVREVASRAARYGYRQEAIRLLDSLFAIQGPSLEGSATLSQKGSILASSGEHQAAIASFEASLAILDSDAERKPMFAPVRGRLLNHLAVSYAMRENFDAAIRSAQSVIDDAPHMPGAMVAHAMRNQSLWLRRLGRDAEAGAILARMIAEYPEDRYVTGQPLGIRLERVQTQYAKGDPNVYAAELSKLWHDPAFESDPLQTWVITNLLDALFQSDTPELMSEEAYAGLNRLALYRDEWLRTARETEMPLVSELDIEQTEIQILTRMISADVVGDLPAALFANRRLAEIAPDESSRRTYADLARRLEAQIAAGDQPQPLAPASR